MYSKVSKFESINLKNLAFCEAHTQVDIWDCEQLVQLKRLFYSAMWFFQVNLFDI